MNKLTFLAIALCSLTSVALAGDPKTAGAPAPKAADPAPAAMPAMPMTAPKELADMSKMMGSSMTCKGQGMGHDMKMADMSATMKSKLDLNGWWIHDSFDAKMGKEPFHFESFTTYDSNSKKYHRAMVEVGGGYSTGDSSGMNAGKMDWDLSSHGMMGDSMFRDHIDASDPKAPPHMWGEASMDKGKTWMKVYDMTCKKG